MGWLVLQELEDEQQKEQALTEVIGSVFVFFSALKSIHDFFFLSGTQAKEKGYGYEKNSRKVMCGISFHSEWFTS